MSSIHTRLSTLDALNALVASKEARVGVFGLGYVGLPFAMEAAEAGYRVIGYDRLQARVDKANQGDSYILDVSSERLQAAVESGLFQATADTSSLGDVDVIIVAVPTPLTKNLTPDLQYVEAVTETIAKHLRTGQFICLESTTYPGTTETVMQPILEKSGLKVEQDFFLAHSPERVDPGNKKYDTKNTPKIVGGVGPQSLDVATKFYTEVIEHVHPVSNASVAEMVKVYENTFRSVNIALANELALLCDRMGLNAWEVLDAANTKPFGIMPFYPGPGVGGHCIPLDPHYLEWRAREFNFVTRFISLAGQINRSMPEFVVDKAARVLNQSGKSLNGARILMLGMAYKKDVGDWRESPGLDVFKNLLKANADAVYHDPFVPKADIDGTVYTSIQLTGEEIAKADLVLVTTDHTTVDYDSVVQHARAVLDTRNALKSITTGREKIVLL